MFLFQQSIEIKKGVSVNPLSDQQQWTIEGSEILNGLSAIGVSKSKIDELNIVKDKTYKRDETENLLGTYFKAFEEWYKETYLKQKQTRDTAFMTTEEQALATAQKRQNEFYTRRKQEDAQSEQKEKFA